MIRVVRSRSETAESGVNYCKYAADTELQSPGFVSCRTWENIASETTWKRALCDKSVVRWTQKDLLLIEWEIDNIHQGWYYQNWCLCNIFQSPSSRSSHSVTGVTAVKPRHAALLYVNIALPGPAQMCNASPAHRYMLNTTTWPHIHAVILHSFDLLAILGRLECVLIRIFYF